MYHSGLVCGVRMNVDNVVEMFYHSPSWHDSFVFFVVAAAVLIQSSLLYCTSASCFLLSGIFFV